MYVSAKIEKEVNGRKEGRRRSVSSLDQPGHILSMILDSTLHRIPPQSHKLMNIILESLGTDSLEVLGDVRS